MIWMQFLVLFYFVLDYRVLLVNFSPENPAVCEIDGHVE